MRSYRSISLLAAPLVVAALLPVAAHPSPSPKAAWGRPGLAQLETISMPASQRTIGIATFGGKRPTDAQARALRQTGLTVQMLRRLPMAFVYGTKAQLRSAVTKGIATDVYPNERLQWLSKESRGSMRADKIPPDLTGKGIGVAIVDSGIDATHPDLADHVTHNVKLVSPEYLNLTGATYLTPDDTPLGYLVIPVDQGPYNNSDLGSGHGTHVSGIVAADGSTSGDQLGVAPDAHLIGYSTGDVALIFTIVAAYDDILVHHKDWGIRVVNNSWGSSFRMFDPSHPINVATKAVHDAGMVVAFSAGNDGDQMTVNPWSVAPWVISVGSATISKERSSFSSGGLEFDGSEPVAIPEDGHLHFDGDRIGIYHPDISAPGSDIVSSGTPTGAYVGPTAPGGTALASGTSMSSPHIAGMAAVLLQARPDLTPDRVRQIIQVTSVPMRDGSVFWQSGYGFADVAAAVDLVRRRDFGPRLLEKLQGERDQALLSDRDWSVRSSDLWTFTPLPATVLGLDFTTYEVEVSAATKAFKASVAYPSLLALAGVNVFDWFITVKDAAGNTVATSQASPVAGVSSLFADLAEVKATDADGNEVAIAYGTWTIELSGDLGTGDVFEPLARTVTLSVVQLASQLRSAVDSVRFVGAGNLGLYFQPEGDPGPLTSPEGCPMDETAPAGGLATGKYTAECRAGTVGYAVNYQADVPAEFLSAPFDKPFAVGGLGVLTLWLADAFQPAYKPAEEASDPNITYALDAVDENGEVVMAIAGAEILEAVESGPSATRSQYELTIPPTLIPAGSRLRLQMRISAFYTSTMRFLYGGEYADAGLTLGVGSFVAGAQAPAQPKPVVRGRQEPGQLPATGVGALPWAGYALVFGAAAVALGVRRIGRGARLRERR